MTTAQTPRGINHVVLNVRDIEVSHRFWTEIMGFRCVAQLKPRPDRVRPKMRFYSGVSESGDVTHHDLALAEAPKREGETDGERESWLKQVEHLREKGVTFHRRINHGMTHSVYISDPDGHGIEVLYELPREIWEHDIDAAQNYAEVLPTEGPEAMVDRVDYPIFGPARLGSV